MNSIKLVQTVALLYLVGMGVGAKASQAMSAIDPYRAWRV